LTDRSLVPTERLFRPTALRPTAPGEAIGRARAHNRSDRSEVVGARTECEGVGRPEPRV